MLKEVFQLALAHAEPMQWPTYDGKTLDRSEFMTSSEVATCLRKAYFAKNQEKYPAKVGGTGENGFTQRGHATEAWFVGMLQPLIKLGYKLEYMGTDQRSFYDPELGIAGTPDGLITIPDGKKYMVEIKSIDPRANKNNLPKKNHLYQVQQNMYLMQHCLDIKIEGAFLIYIDASDYYDIREFPVSYNKDIVAQSVARANELWDATEPDELEPEGIYNGDCDYCGFTQHCSQVVNMQNTLKKLQDVPSPFLHGETLSLNDEERAMVEQWVEAWEGLRQYNNQKDEVDETVRQMVINHNGYLQLDGTGLVGRTQSGRETIDKKLMEADGLDPKKYTKVGAPFVVITVKEGQPE